MEVLVPVPSSSVPCLDAFVRASLVTAIRVASAGSDKLNLTFSCGSVKAHSAVFGNMSWMDDFSNGRCRIDLVRPRVNVENGTSAISGCIRGAHSHFAENGSEVVLVLPFNWYSPVEADMSSLYDVLSDNSPAVFLSGWATESASGYFPGRLASYDDKFYRVEMDNCTVEQLMRTDVPFLTLAKFLNHGLFGGSYDKQRVLYDSNYGRKPPYVLFPKSLHSSVGDGKPQVFFDVLGVCRRFRDRCSDYDDEIADITEVPFNIEEPLCLSHTTR